MNTILRRSAYRSVRSFSTTSPDAGCAAFLGLGAMGYPMAANLRKRRRAAFTESSAADVLVWNRTTSKAEAHAGEHDTRALVTDLSALSEAGVVFTCLPTSDEVRAILEKAAPHLRKGAVVVDCTSGHPQQSRETADWLRDDFGIVFVDCAVSGGPAGAAKGTVAAFVGCDDEAVVASVLPDIQSFAKNIVHLGPAGAGHAVKAINNVMNTTNMLCATEGMLALRKLGVDPAKALSVVNTASGRSLMSMQRLPEEVLTGDFAYGFKLGLMRKDVRIANDLLDEHYPDATIFRETARLMDAALELEDVDGESDYTEAIKIMEHRAGADLRSDTHIEYQKK